MSKRTPGDFLKSVVGRPVVVKLNSGVEYRGILTCLDGFMNIALEQTEEYINGIRVSSFGDAFVRGNNGLFAAFFGVNYFISILHSTGKVKKSIMLRQHTKECQY
ncbi:U6 snRNA-associated Sm-like protein LSm6 [Acrasis kona]|uniref:U6 snRNA-associated Sm-like protein LSm6 n=1 Tax=Acrasis kona TaxID=1008807 RepID=A0AAW2ZK24_9EUKA